MHVFENTKIWDAAKSPHLFYGLPDLNSFHIPTRDTVSNHLKQNNKNWGGGGGVMDKNTFLTKNNDF